MIYFNCDYTEGCHPKILERLVETNMMQTVGYSEDEICNSARAKIRAACGREDIDVHFLVGGTQANATVIASILRPHQGALSAETGHIHVHETGAVEATGHKVLALNNEPYFQHGLLDQGYWSDGLYTPPSDEAMIWDIQTMKDLGFNMLRKHIKLSLCAGTITVTALA